MMNSKLAKIWMSLSGTVCLTVIFIYFYQFIAPKHQMGWDALADFLGALFLSALLSLAISILLAIKLKGQIRQILFWVFTVGALGLSAATWYYMSEQKREQQEQIDKEMRERPPSAPAMEGKMSLGFSQETENDKGESSPLPFGMVKLNFERNTVVHFLSSSLHNATTFDSLVWDNNREISYAPPWFACEILKQDYQIAYMELVSKSRDRLEVIVNKYDRKSTWIDMSEVEVMDTPDFLLNMFAVEALDDTSNPLRQKPLEHAATVTLPQGELVYRPIMIRANWIQVNIHSSNMQAKGTGWLKWSDGKNLLVSYSLLS